MFFTIASGGRGVSVGCGVAEGCGGVAVDCGVADGIGVDVLVESGDGCGVDMLAPVALAAATGTGGMIAELALRCDQAHAPPPISSATPAISVQRCHIGFGVPA